MSRCATVSRDLDEPIAGTAATARTWLLLEQPGPWGAQALTMSHLDPALGRALEKAAEGTGVRIALIRRPGRHADFGPPAVRQVYAAHTTPGNTWLHSATTRDPEQLLDLDFAAFGKGAPQTFETVLQGRPHTGDPLALVCTNGKRDRCCAEIGTEREPSRAAESGSRYREVYMASGGVVLLGHERGVQQAGGVNRQRPGCGPGALVFARWTT